MPLPAPDLDDRRFQDLVDEAKRLIPRYCPEWTNHNVSDPGVALIELFAWMSEMVLFRLNQVPERFYVHFLNLVGIEPFPPSVARADLTFWLSAVLDHPVTVPVGTQVATVGASDREAVVFTTTRDLVIEPPQLRSALTAPASPPGTPTDLEQAYADVWDDLRYEGAAITCFPSPTLTPGDAFYLGFESSLAGMLLRVAVKASAEGIGVDPRNPPLTWEVWGGESWLVATVHDDTTGGLNRDGFISLLVPLRHEPLTLNGMRGYWLRARLLAPAPGQPTYQASPKVRSLEVVALGGTVTAEHAATAGQESLGRSNGRPGQQFTTSRLPILPRRAGEQVRIVDLDGASDWDEVVDFTQSTAHDRHVLIDGATGTVKFGPRVRLGDGGIRQHGAIPRDGAEILLTGYRYGGGAIGNVGAQTLTVLRSAIPFIDRVTNLAPASGGVDAETVADAKIRGPLTLRSGNRAVTPGDFVRLTREASTEVARARCLPPARPGGPVRVLVVPNVRTAPALHQLDDFALPAPLLATIRDHLDERRLVGTAVEVGTPYYQGLSVATLVRSLPGRPATLVRQRVLDVLTRFVNPLTGGAEGDGWPFDADVNAATVAQLIEAVEGVERVDEVLLFEYDLRTGQRLGSGRDLVRLDRDSLFLSAAHQVVVR